MIEAFKKMTLKYRSGWTFIIYCFVGVASALVDVGALSIMDSQLAIDPIYSVSIAYILGLLVNYFLHNAVTFKTSMSKSSFFRYLVIVAFNYALTLMLIYVLQQFGLSLIISKIITLPVISVSGFIFSKLWIYKAST